MSTTTLVDDLKALKGAVPLVGVTLELDEMIVDAKFGKYKDVECKPEEKRTDDHPTPKTDLIRALHGALCGMGIDENARKILYSIVKKARLGDYADTPNFRWDESDQLYKAIKSLEEDIGPAPPEVPDFVFVNGVRYRKVPC